MSSRALRALVRLSVNAWAAPFVDADFETSTGDAVDPGIREDDEVGAAPPLLRVELCYATERGGAHFEPTLETAAEAVLCTLSAACSANDARIFFFFGGVPLMMRAWRAPGLDWYEGYDAADLVPPELPAPNIAFPLRIDGALRHSTHYN
ncbi:hypothetical protein T492DRAFT_844006 [Pavlovales sp. CCMP2436]|nr:hypothetical protein T492DRAFT_844006 [Pavlovales sp. CCMP2436]